VNNHLSLAKRRAQLIEECAHQRAFLAQECEALKAPFTGAGLRDYLGSNKPMLLAAAGVALGLVMVRPRRLLAVGTAALSVWKVARTMLPMLSGPRTG
jgi:hypothetical protein